MRWISIERQTETYLKIGNLFIIAAHEGIIELAEVIKTRNIQTLDLRMNPIGCDGAAAIFGYIFGNKILNKLN